MQDESFEWDDVKAAANWRAHGVSFEMARDVFKDIFAVEWVDDRQGSPEQRFAAVGMVENRLLFCRQHHERRQDSHYLSRRRNLMSDADTTMKTPKHDTKKTPKHDWSRLDAMTDEQAHAAALNDPNAQPLTETDFARLRPVPRVKTLRRALGLTQEDSYAVSNSARHAAGLGAGPGGAGSAGPRLSQGDCARSRGRAARAAGRRSGASLTGVIACKERRHTNP